MYDNSLTKLLLFRVLNAGWAESFDFELENLPAFYHRRLLPDASRWKNDGSPSSRVPGAAT
jgi:hypothetical protein